MSGKQTPEYKKIQENYDKLSSTLARHVLPGDLANKLFAAHLIGEELKQESNREIVGETTRINNLLAAVHNQIELNCKTFQKFIKILEDYDQLTELLKLLKGTLHTSSYPLIGIRFLGSSVPNTVANHGFWSCLAVK